MSESMLVYNDQTLKHVSIQDYVPDSRVRTYITSDTGEQPIFNRFIPDTIKVSPENNETIAIVTDGQVQHATSKTIHPYAEALSGLVVKCVDIAVVDPGYGEILIGTRDQEPHAGDWVIGGRKRAGESDTDSAVQNLRRELGLDIDPSHLSGTGYQYEMIWDSRAQPTTTNQDGLSVRGCHTISTLAILPIDRNLLEIGHNEEYSRLRWIAMEEIIEADSGLYHPTLVDMVTDTLDILTKPVPLAPEDYENGLLRAVQMAGYYRARLSERGIQ